MSRVPKGRWPLRAVVSREQDFRETIDYPLGAIVERLECGHVYRDNIAEHAPEHRSNTRRRKCETCATESIQQEPSAARRREDKGGPDIERAPSPRIERPQKKSIERA